MNTLFPNCVIYLNGEVKTKKCSEHKTNKRGYHCCRLYDIHGNRYYYIHEVIIAEGLQLPKHLWPVDKKGRRYIVDHIIPVSNGGTDSFENLHLIPRPYNNRNPKTRENMSKAKKGNHFSPDTEFKKGGEPWNKGKKYHTGKKRHLTKESRLKISKAKKGVPIKGKKVYQYTLNGELVAVYEKMIDITICNGNYGNISACCKGRKKTAYGYKWSYEPL